MISKTKRVEEYTDLLFSEDEFRRLLGIPDGWYVYRFEITDVTVRLILKELK